MFDFFYAALQQQRQGNAVSVSRGRAGIKAVCARLAVCAFCSATLLLAGYYSHLLYLAWFPAAQPVAELPYKLSTQRYFYKKQPLPEIAEVTETEDAPVEDEQADDSASAEEGDTPPLTENKADLRDRVEQAMKDLHP